MRYLLVLAMAALAAGVGVWLITGEGDGDEDAGSRAVEPGAPQSEPSDPPSSPEEVEPAEESGADKQARAGEAQRAVRRYIEAIDGRDGALLCGLVDGIADLDLPATRSSCAESVSESIGYRDPRGYPVFEKAVVAGTPQVELDGTSARATVTVVTEFADREEASVEDDVIYLVRRGGAWVVAKPSSTLYRAIGTPDVPPDVLQPPQ